MLSKTFESKKKQNINNIKIHYIMQNIKNPGVKNSRDYRLCT